MAFKCGKCDKDFNSKDALEQHQNSKHGTKQMYNYALLGIAVLVILVIAYFIMKGNGSEKKENNFVGDADDKFVLEADAMDNGAMHIHPEIEIVINGESVAIPDNMGISSAKMSVIHIHDASGTMHIESPEVRDFKLKHFFMTWQKWSGKPKVFNSTCILDYCNTADKKTTSQMMNMKI